MQDDGFTRQRPLVDKAFRVVATMLRAAARQGTAHSAGPRAPDLAARLARALGMDRLDAELLRLTLLYETDGVFESLVDAVATTAFRAPPALRADPVLFGLLTGRRAADIAPRFARRGALADSGLVMIESGGALRVLKRVTRLAGIALETDAALFEAIVGPRLPAELPLGAFAHLGDDVARIRKVLAGAVKAREGASVLFAGASGCGKTSLARSLAASIDAPLYAIGQEDGFGNEPSAAERLGELALAQRLLARLPRGQRALLLVDEAEDLYGGGHGGVADPFAAEAGDPPGAPLAGAPGGRSRAFVHTLLETAKVPMILTCNDPRALGGAPFLRRMTCVLHFSVPPLHVRRSLVREAAAAEGMGGVAETQLDALARLPAGPAIARSALRAARLAKDPDIVAWAATGVAQAMRGGGRGVTEAPAESFDPALVTADVDLAGIAARLAAPGAPRDVSLLLSGPPGSGKSAFARHLAARMDLPALEKRASDLLSKFVGGTERAIAQAFAEARAAEAFLIFDEVDGLLGARSGAERSWEISQVNEMLIAMERHRLPFCATTNLIERIDPAAMRRFLIKARFGCLDPARRAKAFQDRFGMPAPPGLATLDALTPADFALVARRAAIEGFAKDPGALLAALAAEQAAKPGQGHGGKIGFLG
jgi:tRNA A37 threonylcarbamoyladenosine biosynthesis protein TsaE